MTREERVAIFASSDLYLVITEAFCRGRSSIQVLTEALDAGVKVVQLREKNLSDKSLYRLALRFREITAKANVLLIIDDRIDIAHACRADGVHLGQDDLPVEAARPVAPELIIGCSSHSADQAITAQNAGADYVNIGPIFATQTKSGPTKPLGLEAIPAVASHITIPWTVMGGIKVSNIDSVLARGAKHVAVVTAITAADDIYGACIALRDKIVNWEDISLQKE
jgi:thiamine-phosphate pyrophosphorylase